MHLCFFVFLFDERKTEKKNQIVSNRFISVVTCAGLQAELDAAYRELNCVKSKLKLQEAELDASRAKYCDKEDDQNLRYSKYSER